MPSDNASDRSLDSLLAGVRRFHRDIYSANRNLYQEAAQKPQQPHTLVVTCADSRIDPEALTQSGPGDIFVTRNIGNLVPAYGEALGATSAVLEYAVSALGVDRIVIMGHTDCGAMKAMLHPEAVASMPTVRNWLRHADTALSIVKARAAEQNENVTLSQLIDENVLLQLNHLRTHPSVAGKLATGKLALYGWVYDIGAGIVRMYDSAAQKFESIPAD